MATIKDIKELALCAAQGKPLADFSVADVNDTLRTHLSALAGDYNAFRRNKYDIFEIIQETADVILPNKVIAAMGAFAEVKQSANGVKIQFKVRLGKQRAKKFVTQVGLSGVYETFRLDTATFDLKGHAIGGAAYIDFERFLSGEENISEYMDIIMEGMEDATYGEVQKALRASLTAIGRPAANIVIENTFNAEKMAKLCAVVKNYGQSATIFATPEFVATMGPDAIGGVKSPAYSVNDIEDIRTKGYIGIFRGNVVTMLPQSYTDETNVTTQIDPQLAYVMPTGGEKVVKVGMEGNTIVSDFTNRDNSMEIQAYKKIGVAILTFHNWGIYQNTAIAQTYVNQWDV